MKKTLLAISAVFSLSAAVPAFAGIDVMIDGNRVPFTTSTGFPFIDENNRTLVPLRAAMEAYDCTVTWNESANTAIVVKDNTVVSVPVGQSVVYVNSKPVTNDTAAKIVDGRVYLPIRVVLEAFGSSVGWNPSSQAVTVTTKSTYEDVATSQSDSKEIVVASTNSDYFNDIYIDNQGDLIFEFHDGKVMNAGKVTGEKGRRGSSGSDGVSVTDAYIDQTGCLIVSLSNGREINAGTVSASSGTGNSPKTFEDYRIGTRWYLSQPAGEFEVDVLIDSEPVTVYFDSIYYELTAKNDFNSDSAWKYEDDETIYTPYEVTVYISGQTDSALSGKYIHIALSDITHGNTYGYRSEINSSGQFHIALTQGGGDNENVWYSPKDLYFSRVEIGDEDDI